MKKASVEREINRYIVALLLLQLATCVGGTALPLPLPLSVRLPVRLPVLAVCPSWLRMR